MTHIDYNSIIKASIQIIKEVQSGIQVSIESDPESAFERLSIEGRAKQKSLLGVDHTAEQTTKQLLIRKLKKMKIRYIGEESLRNERLDLSNQPGIVCLMDMVDGTDLLERDLSNWCSALTFYQPSKQKILASFVGIPNKCVYYATAQDAAAYKQSFTDKEPREIKCNSTEGILLSTASIAFYGQKLKNFFSITKYPKLISTLTDIAQTPSKTRLYNFGGNPMMMKLFDGNTKIDAIFDLVGQAPHDVVPGAFIAEKAGAIFRDLKGNPINLIEALKKPAATDSRISYILTSTESLSQQFLQLVRD